ncbi:hypothetical protein ACP70R_025962 [Stipagrostis hirtigluma subsp. patula]
MSFRRFVNLVASDCLQNTYTLRRIDVARLFLTTKIGNGKPLLGLDPPPTEDCRLPEPAMSFYQPMRDDYCGDMEFMLLNSKVVATDQTGCCFMYDPDLHAVRSLPTLATPKVRPISLAVGKNLYVLDRIPNSISGTGRTFEALIYDVPPMPRLQGNWEQWRALPPPPPTPGVPDDLDEGTMITSCAAVVARSHILVSICGGGGGSRTYCFDTERLVWSEPAAWALPFAGRAEHIPSLHKLWFAISSSDHGYVFCASDLAAADVRQGSSPPVLHTVYDDMEGAPKDWKLIKAHAVHLGDGKFCIARFFSHEPTPGCPYFVVFAGVEVGCGDEGKLHIVKHKSERYIFVNEDYHWLL